MGRSGGKIIEKWKRERLEVWRFGGVRCEVWGRGRVGGRVGGLGEVWSVESLDSGLWRLCRSLCSVWRVGSGEQKKWHALTCDRPLDMPLDATDGCV